MMAVSYNYALAPFDWIPPSGGQPGYHAAPNGSTCVLDLRSNTQAATQGQSAGYGFFAFTGAVPGSAVTLGSGDCRDIQADASLRNAIKTALSLSGLPAGSTLIDCIADAMNSLGDPSGVNGPKPIMPGANGLLELHLGGHSPVWSRMLDVAELLSANPRGHANRIRDVIRADMDEAERIGGAVLMGKALGAKLLSLGFSRDEIKQGASGKKSQWERLLSTAAKAKHGANAKPREPKTSFAEAWPNVAADITATAQTLSWASMQYTLSVNSGGTGFAHAAGATFAIHAVRCTSAVSSADHWADLAVYAFGQPGYFGPMARAASGSFAGYSHIVTFGGSRYLSKWVAGTRTDLSSVATGSWSNGESPRVRANGSTITGSWSGKSDLTATDTAITGNLCGGIVFQDDTNQHQHNKVGAWSIDDELSGGGGGTRHRSKMTLLGNL